MESDHNSPNPGTFGLIRRKVAFHFSADPKWGEYEDVKYGILTSQRTLFYDTTPDVRKCTSAVRNHFVRPIYKLPEILWNRVITPPNPGTFGLIRRKVAFHLFVSCPHGGRGKYFGGFFSCPHGGRGEHFGR